MPKNTTKRYSHVASAKAIRAALPCPGRCSGQGSAQPNRLRRSQFLASAPARSCRLGKSSASVRMKYPSKRMNGLALTASVKIQLVVAKKNKALRIGPSGVRLQAKVASPAKASSVTMPALAMARRCRGLLSFQLSLVSVYSMGNITSMATPMCATRTP